MFDGIYLVAITVGLCATYAALLLFLPFFFNKVRRRIPMRTIIVSITSIILLSVAGYAVALSISDLQLGNRVLHGFGGGFMAFFACFLAARDSGVSVGRTRFFIMAALIVTALGVLNELAELFLERCCDLPLPETLDDTWLDLLSNTVGLLFAALCFVPFFGAGSTEVRVTSSVR
ncbi:hypothetical protein HY416_02855 [Candidatus Kaiserbacteria bacterium]|nr:hypothetical protein [Candidatus Kaiserbacteria bacterium]